MGNGLRKCEAHRRPAQRGALGCAGFTLGLLLAAAAPAAEPGPPRGAAGPGITRVAGVSGVEGVQPQLTVPAALAALGAAKYAQRDRAEHFLLQQPPDQLAAVEKALVATRDSEVLSRLTRVAMHLFLKARTRFAGPASLLGIGLSLDTVRLGPRDEDLRMAVVVTETQPGFPSAEVLRVGDRVIALNGEPFPLDMTFDSFRRHVNTTPPGTIIQLTVLRGRQPLQLSLRLAGVPEEGIIAVGEYVQQRAVAARAYVQQLRAAAALPVTIPTAEETGSPPATDIKF